MEHSTQQKKLEKEFESYENDFIDIWVSGDQQVLVKSINGILKTLDLGDSRQKSADTDAGFNTWTIDKLISAREKLSRYSEPLGEHISQHESRSDFAYIWRKGAYAKDWLPVKTKLGNELGKVTNPEVESELTKKYLGEQYYSMFHRRRADFLIRKLGALDRMIRTIDHRLRELFRQQSLPQEESFQEKRP